MMDSVIFDPIPLGAWLFGVLVMICVSQQFAD